MDDRTEEAGSSKLNGAAVGHADDRYQERLRRAYARAEKAHHQKHAERKQPTAVRSDDASHSWKGYTAATCIGVLVLLALWLLYAGVIRVG